MRSEPTRAAENTKPLLPERYGFREERFFNSETLSLRYLGLSSPESLLDRMHLVFQTQLELL